MKSLVMSLYLSSVAVGNLLTAVVNVYIERGGSTLSGARYYLFFAVAMTATAALFARTTAGFRHRTYLQDETVWEPTLH